MDIPFVDLAPQREALREEIDKAVARVLDHGQFILGPEVNELETRLAEYIHAPYCITCANGTDAITLALHALGIGAGHLVFCPSFTYVATAEAIVQAGAIPVFVDIDHSYTMCPDDLEATIQDYSDCAAGQPAAILAVDLFGLLADYRRIRPIADQFGLKLIADSAQAFGARLDGKTATQWADVATTSFYPTKPLGCYGDGGAIFVRNQELADQLRSLRFHGRSETSADHPIVGMNSRLDTIQAAVLIVKLAHYDDEILNRQQIADLYNRQLQPLGAIPQALNTAEAMASIWSQYTIQVDEPHLLQKDLSEAGIGTARYYSHPVHEQTAYKHFPRSKSNLQMTGLMSDLVISLPTATSAADQIAHILKTKFKHRFFSPKGR